jgi:hypothetical protein
MSDSTKIKIAFERDPAGTRAIQNDLGALNALVEKMVKNVERLSKGLQGMNAGGGKLGQPHGGTSGGKAQGALSTALMGNEDPAVENRKIAAKIKGWDDMERGLVKLSRAVSTHGPKIRQNLMLGDGSIDLGGGAAYMPPGSRRFTGGAGMGGGGSSGGGGGSGIGGGFSGGGASYPGRGGSFSGGGADYPLQNKPPAPSSPKIEQWRTSAAGALIGGAGGSLFGGMGGTMGAIIGAVGGGNGMLGGASRALAPYMGGVGVGLGAAALYNKAAESFENVRSAQVGWTLNHPFAKQQSVADASAPHLAAWQAIQNKDAGFIRSFHRVMRDPEKMKSLNDVSLTKEKMMLATNESPVSISGLSKKAQDALSGVAGMGFQAAGEYIAGAKLNPAEQGTVLDIARKAAYYGAPREKAAQLIGAVHNDMSLDPLRTMLTSKVYGGALGRVQEMRAAGMSTGIGPNGSNYEVFESNLLKGGWTIGDYAAGRSQMLGVGAGYMKALGPIGAVSAGIGGLSNAAELVRSGGILGGSVGAAKGFYRNVQGSIGRGGLDVATGRDFFGGASSSLLRTGQMGAGDTASTYMRGTAGLIAGGIGAPNDVAQQQRLAAALSSGTENLAAFTSGTKAPLYQATSLLGGIGAMGGYGTAAEGLSGMRPEVVAGIMRGGEVPVWAKALGIDKDAVSSFGNYQRKSPFFEVMDQGLESGSRASELMSKIRGFEGAGGSYVDMFRDETKGLKGKAKSKKITQLAEELSGVLSSQGLAASPEEAMGTLMAPLSQDKEFSPFLKGKGVGAAKPKGLEAEALAEQAKILANHADTIAKNVKDMSEVIKAMADAEKGQLAAIKAVAALEDADLDTIIQTTTTGLQAFNNYMKLHGKEIKQNPVKANASQAVSAPKVSSGGWGITGGFGVR